MSYFIRVFNTTTIYRININHITVVTSSTTAPYVIRSDFHETYTVYREAKLTNYGVDMAL